MLDYVFVKMRTTHKRQRLQRLLKNIREERLSYDFPPKPFSHRSYQRPSPNNKYFTN